METKLLEIRDIGTRIMVICTKLQGEDITEKSMLKSAGFSPITNSILLVSMPNCEARYDPFKLKDRTYFTAHRYIAYKWDDLETGDVIDVEYILKEKTKIKKAEWKEYAQFV